ncbi:MAG TPA: hypothetical protein VLM89_05925 [Phycisphaerae bacterium]|nr:hypothetical protein [Phycisphaerae bacterium]
MSKNMFAWLRLLAAGSLLFATANSCLSRALRDAADGLDDTPQNLNDVKSWGDFTNWFDSQFGGDD